MITSLEWDHALCKSSETMGVTVNRCGEIETAASAIIKGLPDDKGSVMHIINEAIKSAAVKNVQEVVILNHILKEMLDRQKAMRHIAGALINALSASQDDPKEEVKPEKAEQKNSSIN